MAEEFENINSRLPDLGSVLAQRIATKQADQPNSLPPAGTVDPYKMMLQKKRAAEAGDIDPGKVMRWPEEATTKLQDYCLKMGIVGFNSGQMHPLAALAMLKKQYGEDYTDVPLEERIPEGYEKAGTRPPYNPSYPYSEVMRKKQILHG